MPSTIPVYIACADEDAALRDDLVTHLAALQRHGLISIWHRGLLAAGEDVDVENGRRLRAAQVIVLLVSSDFIATDRCMELEAKQALERQATGEVRVVPVLGRPVDWEAGPFAALEPLPRNRQPITQWPDRDRAWVEVVRELRAILADLAAAASTRDAPPAAAPTAPGGPTHAAPPSAEASAALLTTLLAAPAPSPLAPESPRPVNPQPASPEAHEPKRYIPLILVLTALLAGLFAVRFWIITPDTEVLTLAAFSLIAALVVSGALPSTGVVKGWFGTFTGAAAAFLGTFLVLVWATPRDGWSLHGELRHAPTDATPEIVVGTCPGSFSKPGGTFEVHMRDPCDKVDPIWVVARIGDTSISRRVPLADAKRLPVVLDWAEAKPPLKPTPVLKCGSAALEDARVDARCGADIRATGSTNADGKLELSKGLPNDCGNGYRLMIFHNGRSVEKELVEGFLQLQGTDVCPSSSPEPAPAPSTPVKVRPRKTTVKGLRCGVVGTMCRQILCEDGRLNAQGFCVCGYNAIGTVCEPGSAPIAPIPTDPP